MVGEQGARTRVNGVISKARHLKTGLPQKAVLSPTLFIVYIIDLLNSTVSAFADDLALNSSERRAHEKWKNGARSGR